MRAPTEQVLYVGADITPRPGSVIRGGALLVGNGRVLAIGEAAAVEALARPDATRIDCHGTGILPGLIDGHCHLGQIGYLASAIDLSPTRAPDIDSIQQRLAEGSVDATGWLVGHGYMPDRLADRRHPKRQDLDALSPKAPCVVYHVSLHACVVNSVALQVLGLDDTSPDPPGGRFGRDAQGRLDGRLVERPMFDLFAAAISRRLAADGPGLAEAATVSLAAFGITTAIDGNTTRHEYDALTSAEGAGRLRIRVGSLVRYEDLDPVLANGRTRSTDPARLWIVGAKAFADGGMSSRTAAVDAPYVGSRDDLGMLLLDEDELTERAARCADLDLALGVHAQGERAIAAALAAFGRVRGGRAGGAQRIEHGGAFRPRLQQLAADLGVAVISQPAFISSLGDGFREAFGARRTGYLYPFADLLRRGVALAGSSDAPVVTASPFLAMRDAMARGTASGRAFGPDQGLTATQALSLYTVNGAAVIDREGELGILAPGSRADFVIVDNLELADGEGIAGAQPRATIVAGVEAWRRPSEAGAAG